MSRILSRGRDGLPVHVITLIQSLWPICTSLCPSFFMHHPGLPDQPSPSASPSSSRSSFAADAHRGRTAAEQSWCRWLCRCASPLASLPPSACSQHWDSPCGTCGTSSLPATTQTLFTKKTKKKERNLKTFGRSGKKDKHTHHRYRRSLSVM